MLNKKGYMITPILFIVFFLIAIIFSIYVSDIDSDSAQGIRISASIEKGITDIYKMQNEQINFAKLSAYECSESQCYNISKETIIEYCINKSLNKQYGNFSWSPDLINNSNTIYLYFNLNAFNATNINMNSNRSYTQVRLNNKFFNKC